MFSKEESKKLRQEFWTSFGKSFPRKWLLYDTKMKGLSFKFHFDKRSALVALDLEDDLDKRIAYWEKLQGLKSILINDYLPEVIFEEVYILDNHKEISRIYVPLDLQESIHDKSTWREVMVFLNDTMSQFEAFFKDYRDVIDS